MIDNDTISLYIPGSISPTATSRQSESGIHIVIVVSHGQHGTWDKRNPVRCTTPYQCGETKLLGGTPKSEITAVSVILEKMKHW